MLLNWSMIVIIFVFGTMAIVINFIKGKEEERQRRERTEIILPETPEKIKKRLIKENRKIRHLSHTNHHRNDNRKVWGAFGKRGI